jgi:hypothetical protein
MTKYPCWHACKSVFASGPTYGSTDDAMYELPHHALTIKWKDHVQHYFSSVAPMTKRLYVQNTQQCAMRKFSSCFDLHA